MQRLSDFLRDFCRSSIESKRKNPEARLANKRDILTVAMRSNGFSDEDLVEQIMIFLAAGTLPVAATIA